MVNYARALSIKSAAWIYVRVNSLRLARVGTAGRQPTFGSDMCARAGTKGFVQYMVPVVHSVAELHYRSSAVSPSLFGCLSSGIAPVAEGRCHAGVISQIGWKCPSYHLA